jgi:hypothetical protein
MRDDPLAFLAGPSRDFFRCRALSDRSKSERRQGFHDVAADRVEFRYTSRRGPAREANGRRPVRIWLNPFWGPVADNGRTFEQMNLYETVKKRIETIVSLPAFNDELFPQDIASMLKSRLTFKEAIEPGN